MTETTTTGGCECGGVKYQVTGAMRPVVFCHCGQCRRTSGHFVAATATSMEHFKLLVDDQLAWYRSSDLAQRGFCQRCGSSLFWQPDHREYISIMAGTVDMPSGLTAETHIFMADAGDYYSIADGLPQHADGDGGIELSVPE